MRDVSPCTIGSFVLLRVSLLTEDVPLITELDLNPIFALPPGQGCRLVDARIWVGPAKA